MQAKGAAAAPYQPNEATLPDSLAKLNYDSYRKITFRGDRSLWHSNRGGFEVQFFHPGYLFRQPVAVHEVAGGNINPVRFSPKYFRYPHLDPGLLAREKTLGFAGLRILYPLNHARRKDEIISFLGSNYFRALGAGQIYGISARGIAIDTAPGLTEEFPAFKEFWLCKPQRDQRQVEFFALLDGPSVTGAYRFVVRPGPSTVLDIEAHLFFRKSVQVLGLAPLTSMFWRGENQPLRPNDPRPEVHDSDGLLMKDASGKSEWHPLTAVERISTQNFAAGHPQGFGLLQRDREASHYRDHEAKYERRPSVWVESLGDWGGGAIRLMQLPATNEYNDNMVAFWQPQKVPKTGEEILFQYRLHWFRDESNKP
jgi:glucans biosynthesis protein